MCCCQSRCALSGVLRVRQLLHGMLEALCAGGDLDLQQVISSKLQFNGQFLMQKSVLSALERVLGSGARCCATGG